MPNISSARLGSSTAADPCLAHELVACCSHPKYGDFRAITPAVFGVFQRTEVTDT